MLLNSTGVIPRSRYTEEVGLLRSKIDELNKNTVILIAQAEKLIQESERLSARVNALENPSRIGESAVVGSRTLV